MVSFKWEAKNLSGKRRGGNGNVTHFIPICEEYKVEVHDYSTVVKTGKKGFALTGDEVQK